VDAAPPPADAAPPLPEDAAPPPADADAPLAADAGAGPDAALLVADGPPAPDVALGGSEVALVLPDAGGPVSSVDATGTADAAARLDVATGAQGGISADGGIADATVAPAKDAGRDGASDAAGGGGGGDCSCDVGGPARGRGAAVAWLAVLLPVLLRRRRRSAGQG
jgi:MYXO-CTERM domain-containing protein